MKWRDLICFYLSILTTNSRQLSHVCDISTSTSATIRKCIFYNNNNTNNKKHKNNGSMKSIINTWGVEQKRRSVLCGALNSRTEALLESSGQKLYVIISKKSKTAKFHPILCPPFSPFSSSVTVSTECPEAASKYAAIKLQSIFIYI